MGGGEKKEKLEGQRLTLLVHLLDHTRENISSKNNKKRKKIQWYVILNTTTYLLTKNVIVNCLVHTFIKKEIANWCFMSNPYVT